MDHLQIPSALLRHGCGAIGFIQIRRKNWKSWKTKHNVRTDLGEGPRNWKKQKNCKKHNFRIDLREGVPKTEKTEKTNWKNWKKKTCNFWKDWREVTIYVKIMFQFFGHPLDLSENYVFFCFSFFVFFHVWDPPRSIRKLCFFCFSFFYFFHVWDPPRSIRKLCFFLFFVFRFFTFGTHLDLSENYFFLFFVFYFFHVWDPLDLSENYVFCFCFLFSYFFHFLVYPSPPPIYL